MSELPPSTHFPPASMADEDGVVAVGGRLDPEWLLDAYRHGIFPWPLRCDLPVFWFSPDPRAIIPLEHLKFSGSLRKTLRRSAFRVTCDRAFDDVIVGCATGPGRELGTWITPQMIEAYCQLHRLGVAHSVEAWQGDTLAGGVYGVAVAGLFAAESMFYRVSNASKVALACLLAHVRRRGYQLFDVQMTTEHTERFGATNIARNEYLRRLADALTAPVSFGDRLEVAPGDLPA